MNPPILPDSSYFDDWIFAPLSKVWYRAGQGYEFNGPTYSAIVRIWLR